VDDVIFLGLMVVFVVVSALFVVGCDKIIGPDDAALGEHGERGDLVGVSEERS